MTMKSFNGASAQSITAKDTRIMNTRVCNTCGRELPEDKYRMTRYGHRMTICCDCITAKNIQTRKEKKDIIAKANEKEVSEARTLRLQDFEPRELMKRLAELGYEGELTVTKRYTVDITKL